jgi:hypothetical protein
MRPRAQTALAARRLQVRNCYWVAVPRQLYAQRLNNRSDLPQRFHPGRVRRLLWPPRMHARRVNDAPCPPFTSHGASIMLQCGARRHPITTAASENLCHCFGLLIMKYHGCVAGGAPATVDRGRRHKRVRNNAPHRLLAPALALRLLRNTPTSNHHDTNRSSDCDSPYVSSQFVCAASHTIIQYIRRLRSAFDTPQHRSSCATRGVRSSSAGGGMPHVCIRIIGAQEQPCVET